MQKNFHPLAAIFCVELVAQGAPDGQAFTAVAKHELVPPGHGAGVVARWIPWCANGC